MDQDGLLAAAVIAGADPKACFGIELDPAIADIARERLSLLGVPSCNIRTGDALDDDSYDFDGQLHDETVCDIENIDYRSFKLCK